MKEAVKKGILKSCVAATLAIVLGILLWFAAIGARAEITRMEAQSLSMLVVSPFIYSFNVDGILSEAASPYKSASPYWWLNSGGALILQAGVGRTIQGTLPEDNIWRRTYARTNPIDTDYGYHPQNIFRLFTRSAWDEFRQEVYVMINADNMSGSPNRNESNGVLLFNRFKEDSENLYYAGIRVDGTAVIKKKINGVYYTLAQESLIQGAGRYDRRASPNILPKGEWIGLRSEIVTTSDYAVEISLYTHIGRTGEWTLAVEATDSGLLYGPIIEGEGYAGIRTDFMDVDFMHFRIDDLDEDVSVPVLETLDS